MTEQSLTYARPADELVSFVAPASLEANQYRSLRHLVERLHRDSGFQVFAVTSPGSSDGKTVTTLNVAGSLAQSRDARVAIIDADLHRPTVARYLGIEPTAAPGLVDLLSDETRRLEDATRRFEALNVSVILTGHYEAGAYELLNSPRLDSLIQEARQRFDYIFIDTPPLTPLPDCRLLGRGVDGFFLVVAAHRTPRRALGEALDLIDRTKLIGMVFNGDDQPLRRYSAYYAYSEPVGVAARHNGRTALWRKAFKDPGRR
jgi:capsular exopolysaccharide synthesis family protein